MAFRQLPNEVWVHIWKLLPAKQIPWNRDSKSGWDTPEIVSQRLSSGAEALHYEDDKAIAVIWHMSHTSIRAACIAYRRACELWRANVAEGCVKMVIKAQHFSEADKREFGGRMRATSILECRWFDEFFAEYPEFSMVNGDMIDGVMERDHPFNGACSTFDSVTALYCVEKWKTTPDNVLWHMYQAIDSGMVEVLLAILEDYSPSKVQSLWEDMGEHVDSQSFLDCGFRMFRYLWDNQLLDLHENEKLICFDDLDKIGQHISKSPQQLSDNAKCALAIDSCICSHTQCSFNKMTVLLERLSVNVANYSESILREVRRQLDRPDLQKEMYTSFVARVDGTYLHTAEWRYVIEYVRDAKTSEELTIVAAAAESMCRTPPLVPFSESESE